MPWESNPNNLPVEVALAIEENAANATPGKDEQPPDEANVVERLKAVRERLFWLQSVWAVSLSPDVALEADRYRQLFHDLASRVQDRREVDALVAGHEALLLCDPSPPKPTLPIATQRMFELTAEVRTERSRPARPTPQGYVPDGLQRFV